MGYLSLKIAWNRILEFDSGLSAVLSVTNARVNAEYFEFRFLNHTVRHMCIVQKLAKTEAAPTADAQSELTRNVSFELWLADDLENQIIVCSFQPCQSYDTNNS